MSKFAFALQQRVLVPEQNGAQGVVTMRTESVNSPNGYHVDWLQRSGQTVGAWFTETEMLAANAPEPAPVSVAELKTAIVKLADKRPSSRKSAKLARKAKRK